MQSVRAVWRKILPYSRKQTVRYSLGVFTVSVQPLLKRSVLKVGANHQQYHKYRSRHKSRPRIQEKRSGQIGQQRSGIPWMPHPEVGSARYNPMASVGLYAHHTGEVAVLDQGVGGEGVTGRINAGDQSKRASSPAVSGIKAPPRPRTGANILSQGRASS